MTPYKYIEELETLISDELLPAYVELQRRQGFDPNINPIIKKLIVIMKKKKNIPSILFNKLNKK